MKDLLLEKCTKTKCERCDIGYILKEYIKPLMQALTIDVKDYYMRLLTTKCLNTAVLLAYFMAGKKRGIAMANYCDTRATTKRHEEGQDNNTVILKKTMKDILTKNVKYRYLYYILLTDGYLPMDDPSEEQKFFCGHVMIIEKIPDKIKPYYYFYQSYINEYDLKGHIKNRNNSLRMNYEEMESILNKIKYVILNKYWDENSVKYWKDITHVDSSNLLNSKPEGKIYICYRKTKLEDCIGNIQKYVKTKLKTISKYNESDMNKIYGDPALYNSGQEPLTVHNMKLSFENLQNTLQIKSHYK